MKSISRIFSRYMSGKACNNGTSPLPLGASHIKKLNHIAIAYKDCSGPMDFYRNVLRLPVSDKLPQQEHGVSTIFVELGEHAAMQPKIELLEPLGNKSPIAGFLDKNPRGAIHHLCFEVYSLEASVKELEEKHGIKPIGPVKIGAHGKPVAFFHPKDCHGLLVELEQA